MSTREIIETTDDPSEGFPHWVADGIGEALKELLLQAKEEGWTIPKGKEIYLTVTLKDKELESATQMDFGDLEPVED